jgi:hypothetical protein
MSGIFEQEGVSAEYFRNGIGEHIPHFGAMLLLTPIVVKSFSFLLFSSFSHNFPAIQH